MGCSGGGISHQMEVKSTFMGAQHFSGSANVLVPTAAPPTARPSALISCRTRDKHPKSDAPHPKPISQQKSITWQSRLLDWSDRSRPSRCILSDSENKPALALFSTKVTRGDPRAANKARALFSSKVTRGDPRKQAPNAGHSHEGDAVSEGSTTAFIKGDKRSGEQAAESTGRHTPLGLGSVLYVRTEPPVLAPKTHRFAGFSMQCTSGSCSFKATNTLGKAGLKSSIQPRVIPNLTANILQDLSPKSPGDKRRARYSALGSEIGGIQRPIYFFLQRILLRSSSDAVSHSAAPSGCQPSPSTEIKPYTLVVAFSFSTVFSFCTKPRHEESQPRSLPGSTLVLG
ncbi:hypothetical protein Anapl_16750 [Anas platyrhynchos]|uniref:Uncharacterized protein n=1 Tax=Anas platyrhynchos TaxID=8839 RepID=R0JJ23_ANAPL|nr:hypothetical protein Anapl_16750 [Anas platyrhynchos]